MKLIKYLKGFLVPMIFLVAILGVRVVAELALPTYTSNIVDKGIQQSGIQDAVPEKISEKSFRELQLFMTDDEIEKVTSKYTKDGDVYKLDSINDQERSELNDIFKNTMTVVSGAKSENLDLDKVAEGVKLGLVKKDSLIEQKNKSISDLGSSADMITKQAGIRYVKEEYRNNVGIDTNEIRKNYLKEVGIMMIIVTFISGVGSVISNFIASRISSKIAYNLREKLYNKVLSFSKQDIDKFSTASLITRSTNDIQQIQNALNMMLFIAIYAPMMAVYGVYKVTQTDTGMTWIIALGVGILGLTLGIISFLVMPKFKIMQRLIDRVNLVTREALTGISVIRMMAFITYTMQIVMSFLFFTFLMMQLPRAEVAAGRINEVLETEVTVVDNENIDDSKLQDVKGTLKFDNVSFTFDGADSPVLSNISFEAEAGKTTAIIGSTGSGKSTLLHLIPRYFDASEGEISIDGVNIRDISLNKLRDILGFVPQKGVLFSGNIESNIKFADENITDEQMKKAAEIAQAIEFINEKEDKFNSEISQGGSNVSGGQKQRLSIARALAKNPKILLFDDSFSALDYKTDVKLRKTLRKEMAGVTTIIVAQRIATILNADKIIVMNEGKIVGVGKHQELLETCPTYLEIAESQLSEEELQKGGKHHG